MFGLLKRRECLVPTWRGWVILLLALGVGGWVAVVRVHSILAVNAPVSCEVLVVEGWLTDRAFLAARGEASRGWYKRLYVTGGPIESGAFLSGYSNYARLGQLTLERLGQTNPPPVAVPAPYARQDRTYASAVALRRWLEGHGGVPSQMNVVSLGPHARRTRLLFEKAFGTNTTIGIVAVPVEDYDPERWWTSSAGVRRVVDELVAYFYARCLFRVPEDRSLTNPSGSKQSKPGP